MISVAFKMLIGNRASFIGVIFGVFLAILLISQQSAIFLGLVARSYRMVNDISSPNIWIIDPATTGEDLIRTMPEEYLQIVRSIPDIEWAAPIKLMEVPVTTPAGVYKIGYMYGIDDALLVGAPTLIAGHAWDLRREGAVILDSLSAADILAKVSTDGKKTPLTVGDTLEINGQHAVIVGIGKITPGFFPQPNIFTTNLFASKISGNNRISFIAAKTKAGANVQNVLNRINSLGKFSGLTKEEFEWKIAWHFLKTGIFINFGLSLLLGLIIGLSITGQIFYIMTLDNLHYFALIKALGGTEKMILKMIIFQAALVGLIGYILGTGATLLWGYAIKNTTLAFLFPWQLLVMTGFIAIIICLFTTILSARKVFSVDPQILMTE